MKASLRTNLLGLREEPLLVKSVEEALPVLVLFRVALPCTRLMNGRMIVTPVLYARSVKLHTPNPPLLIPAAN